MHTATTSRDTAVETLASAFAGGSRTVLLRGGAGIGVGEAALGYAAGKAVGGKVLVVAPFPVHGQVRAELERLEPGARVASDPDEDARFEVRTSLAAILDAKSREPGTFALVVVEEHHAAFHYRVREVRARFPGVPFVEVARMPRPYPAALAADAEIDLAP